MTVVCGHTHMPFTRLAHGRLVVNPGSVGMPYGRAGAHGALLADGVVTLRRSVYDAGAACAAIRDQSGYPDAAEWADYFVHARASDAAGPRPDVGRRRDQAVAAPAVVPLGSR